MKRYIKSSRIATLEDYVTTNLESYGFTDQDIRDYQEACKLMSRGYTPEDIFIGGISFSETSYYLVADYVSMRSIEDLTDADIRFMESIGLYPSDFGDWEVEHQLDL